MSYAIIILLIFSLTLLIFDHNRRFSLLFIFMALGCILSLFSTVLQINLFGNYYSYSTSNLYDLDYRIYIYLVRHARMSFGKMLRIMNLGSFIYLFSNTMFITEIAWNMERIKSERLLLAVVCLQPLTFLIYSDPKVSNWIYLACHRNTVFHMLTEGSTLIYKAVALLLLISPVIMLLIYGRRMRVHYFKKHIDVLAASLGLLNIAYARLFLFGPFAISASKAIETGFWQFGIMSVDTQFSCMAIALALMGIMVFILVVLLHFRFDQTFMPFMEYRIRRNIEMINDILRDMLHSQKNMLFAMQIYMRKAKEECAEADIKGLKDMDAFLKTSMEMTVHMLNNLANVRLRFVQNDLLQVIKNAVSSVYLPPNIHLILDDDKLFSQVGYYDKYHVEKALINILNNAVEAIECLEKPEGHIQVEMQMFFRSVVVAVNDDGVGIRKKDLKKLFMPHYSNKKGNLNWGLGLSYVRKIINAHYGQVRIASRYGEYTTVLIILPQKGRKRE